MKKNYQLFLFDLDDTLLDFQASQKLSFQKTLQACGVDHELIDEIYGDYQKINAELWAQFENAQTTKDQLKVERFKKLFELYQIEVDPLKCSQVFLDLLPENVVLIEHAVETLDWLRGHGEIGIITNGISYVQKKRIENSQLKDLISFIAVSEDCGFAKPDKRFFEYSSKMAKNFVKDHSLVIGDRFEADILGAHLFNVDSCWFNPSKNRPDLKYQTIDPQYEIRCLSELRECLKLGQL